MNPNLYDAANQLLSAEDTSGVTTYTYDANGNRLTIEEPNGDLTTNTWDPENRLVMVEHPGGGTTEYAYDGDGKQVEKTIDGTDTTKYIYDGNNMLQETDGSGTVEAKFTYTLGTYGKSLSQIRGSDSHVFHFDGTDNVRLLTDDTGSITDEYEFDAFGNLLSSTGSTPNSQLYKGRHLAYHADADAGPELQYALHHRNYEPSLGIFSSRDPAEDDSNLYRYVKNNPINKVDPSGLGDAFETFDSALTKIVVSMEFLSGVGEGFFSDGLLGTVEGAWDIAKLSASKGLHDQYRKWGFHQWASETEYGQLVGAGQQFARESGPTVQALFQDLAVPWQQAKSWADLQPETRAFLLAVLPEIGIIQRELSQYWSDKSTEEKSHLIGRLVGVGMFEVAAAAATSGAATAAKASILPRLTKVLKAEKLADAAKPITEAIERIVAALRRSDVPNSGPKGRAAADGAFSDSRSLQSGLQRQADDFDCGATCVEHYLRRQGIDPSDLDLRYYVDYDPVNGGSVADDLVDMLARAGKQAKAHKLVDKNQKVLPGAFDDMLRTQTSDLFVLVQSKDGGPAHWVLIEGIAGNNVRYFDPSTGQRLYGTLDEFRARFLGPFVEVL